MSHLLKSKHTQDRFNTRPETHALLLPGKPIIMLDPVKEESLIASILEIQQDDLTDLPYGRGSRMWMSRSAQIGGDAVPNKAATHALQINNAKSRIVIRGPVLVQHTELRPGN